MIKKKLLWTGNTGGHGERNPVLTVVGRLSYNKVPHSVDPTPPPSAELVAL